MTEEAYENIEILEGLREYLIIKKLDRISWPKVKDENEKCQQRYDSLLLYGVQNMSSDDVFSYFQDITPKRIEWIDAYNCILVWSNCEDAYLVYSSYTCDISDLFKITNHSLPDYLNPVVKQWRISKLYRMNELLFLRYATLDDKKLQGIHKISLYYANNYKSVSNDPISFSRPERVEKLQHEYQITGIIPDIDIDPDPDPDTSSDSDKDSITNAHNKKLDNNIKNVYDNDKNILEKKRQNVFSRISFNNASLLHQKKIHKNKNSRISVFKRLDFNTKK